MSVGQSHTSQREHSLAAAVATLVEALHTAFPGVVTRPIPPYEEEDFTLEVQIPPGLDRDTVMNACIRQALELEDTTGFVILAHVKPAVV